MRIVTSIALFLFFLAYSPPTVFGGQSIQINCGHEFIPNPAAPGERVEFFWNKPAGPGPFPVVVFLHGHQEPGPGRIGGRAFIDYGVLEAYARAGVLAVSVSQPGYGESEGRADFCGPKTQAAVRAVVAHFRQMKEVDPNRVALEGVSRGAVVVAMVASQDAKLAAVILISGAYDIKALSETPQWSSEKDLQEETDYSGAAFLARSALYHVGQIKSPILVLHGAKDANAPVEQAEKFAQALERAHVAVELKIFPAATHQVPLGERTPIINSFLRRYLNLLGPLPSL